MDLELKEISDVYDEYTLEWNLYIAELYHRLKIDKEEVADCDSCDVRDTSPKMTNPAVIKRMYRDIAHHVHPDKNADDEDMARLMRYATKAKESNDMIALMDMCDDLGIDTPKLRDSHLKYIEDDISSKQHQIDNMKNSNQWVWSTSDAMKKKLIESSIVKQLTDQNTST